MPVASWVSMNSRLNSSISVTRTPGTSVYCRSSTTGQHVRDPRGTFHEFHDPVSFPSFASIVGERLLPMRFGGEIRPQKANANRFSLKSIVGVKRSDADIESADHRRIEMA